MCGPRSLRIRMWIGIWPPSKRARSLAPEREPAPFWPRPEVLPVPEPSPRPTRLRGLAAARGRASGVQADGSSVGSSASRRAHAILLDLHEVADAVDHAARLRRVLDLDRVADAAQAERAQRVELALVGAVLRLDLGDLQRRSRRRPPARRRRLGSASAASARRRRRRRRRCARPSLAAARSRPSTSLIDRPRSSATSSGVRRPCRPGDRRLDEVDRVLRAEATWRGCRGCRRARAPRARRRRR